MRIVVTEHSKQPDDKLTCRYCDKTIAEIVKGTVIPSYAECYKNGSVPVPNFGWLCSQDCAERFEKENDIKFLRTVDGKIAYYNGSLE